MTKITITTTISTEFHEYCKKNDLKWSDMISRGVRHHMNGRNQEEEINNLQENMKKMSSKLNSSLAQIWELEQKNKKVN